VPTADAGPVLNTVTAAIPAAAAAMAAVIVLLRIVSFPDCLWARWGVHLFGALIRISFWRAESVVLFRDQLRKNAEPLVVAALEWRPRRFRR
jgi:hypothetical protein